MRYTLIAAVVTIAVVTATWAADGLEVEEPAAGIYNVKFRGKTVVVLA